MNDQFIKVTRKDGTVEYINKDYDSLVANPPSPPEEYVVIPEEELQQWKNTEYQRLRASAYPTIQDQLDSLFKAGVFPEDMAVQIQAVKDKYPKP